MTGWFKLVMLMSVVVYVMHIKMEIDAHEIIEHSAREQAQKTWRSVEQICMASDISHVFEVKCNELKQDFFAHERTQPWWACYVRVVRTEYQEHLEFIVGPIIDVITSTVSMCSRAIQSTGKAFQFLETLLDEGKKYSVIIAPVLILFICVKLICTMINKSTGALVNGLYKLPPLLKHSPLSMSSSTIMIEDITHLDSIPAPALPPPPSPSFQTDLQQRRRTPPRLMLNNRYAQV